MSTASQGVGHRHRGEREQLRGADRQGGSAERTARNAEELPWSEGHGMLLRRVSGWAGSQVARQGAGGPPACRAARSESLCCDLTGPADTPRLGPGQECCRERGHASLHSQYTRLSRKPRGVLP